MPKQITIEIPEELYALVESDPLLKLLLEKIIKEDVMNYVLSVIAMDKLTEESKLTEEDINKLDKEIKRRIREKIENEVNC
ncbi:MAG: hypothetical protein ACP5KW_09465 [Thermoproteota archaeon]|jgi:hypothetical protein